MNAPELRATQIEKHISQTQHPEPTCHEVYEKVTGTWQYVVADPSTSKAVIIDPVLDFDPRTGKIWTEAADALLKLIDQKGYTIEMILETHAHADHMTAASYHQARLHAKQGQRPLICIGSRIKQVQQLFGERYNISPEDYEGVFDKLLADNEEFQIGLLTAQALHLPGHTPDHMGYKIGSNVFVGDSLFLPDLGSARADFPGGSASALYESGRKLLALPPDTRIWVGHDYPLADRDAVPYVTVMQQREGNKHLKDGVGKEEFVRLREERDGTLKTPRLLHASLQMNVRAGRLPPRDERGERMLLLPVSCEVEW
ncbi:Metallo-beta-lactamase-like protein 3 [Elsinoe fawcettii]|nr:Metallo-beta-lactamase-like protein 3 [Elsinoe fawcettii]